MSPRASFKFEGRIIGPRHAPPRPWQARWCVFAAGACTSYSLSRDFKGSRPCRSRSALHSSNVLRLRWPLARPLSWVSSRWRSGAVSRPAGGLLTGLPVGAARQAGLGSGFDSPPTTVFTNISDVRMTLLASGRYLTTLPASVLRNELLHHLRPYRAISQRSVSCFTKML
jgi:hypothetical protein